MNNSTLTFFGIIIKKLIQKKINVNFDIIFFIDSPFLPINEVFGEQYDGFIDKVFENTVPATRRKIIELGIKREYDFHLATEEYLAELAEKGFEREKGFLRTIKSLFTDMFHRAKIKLGFD